MWTLVDKVSGNLLFLNRENARKLSGAQKWDNFADVKRRAQWLRRSRLYPRSHYCRRTRRTCAGKMARTFLKTVLARHLPPLSLSLSFHGASIVALGKFPLFSRHPPSDSPPFCPLAFSRRQILKSIEFPVGQTTKLPPNNPRGWFFNTLQRRREIHTLSYNFVRVLLVTNSNVIIINAFLYFKIYIALFRWKK